MATNFPARSLFRGILGIGMLACLAASPGDLSLHDAWLQAPKNQGPNWNREKELHRLLAGRGLVGMSRTQILSLLGQPGSTTEGFPEHLRTDEYRMSEANDHELALSYNARNFVQEAPELPGSCECPLCTTTAPLISSQTLENSGTLQIRSRPSWLTVAWFNRKLGKPGKQSISHEVVDDDEFVNYAQTGASTASLTCS